MLARTPPHRTRIAIRTADHLALHPALWAALRELAAAERCSVCRLVVVLIDEALSARLRRRSTS